MPPDDTKPAPPPELRSTSDPAAVPLLEDLLRRGATLRLRVTGKSMAPAVVAGDVVTIQKVEPAHLRVGDLVFVKRGDGTPVLHRMLRRTRTAGGETALVVMGDASPGADEPVPAQNVLGRASLVERTAGDGRTKQFNLDTPPRRLVARLAVLRAQSRRVLAAIRHRLILLGNRFPWKRGMREESCPPKAGPPLAEKQKPES